MDGNKNKSIFEILFIIIKCGLFIRMCLKLFLFIIYVVILIICLKIWILFKNINKLNI